MHKCMYVCMCVCVVCVCIYTHIYIYIYIYIYIIILLFYLIFSGQKTTTIIIIIFSSFNLLEFNTHCLITEVESVTTSPGFLTVSGMYWPCSRAHGALLCHSSRSFCGPGCSGEVEEALSLLGRGSSFSSWRKCPSTRPRKTYKHKQHHLQEGQKMS